MPSVPAKTSGKSRREKVSLSKKKRKLFLQVLARTGKIGLAAQAVGYQDSSYLRRVYNDDEDFAAEWDHAIQAAADILEDEAFRRARDGTMKPVFYKGKVVGYDLQYSDSLLMFLLKGARPDKFADRKKVDHEIDGKIGVALLPMTIPDMGNWEKAAAIVHEQQAAGAAAIDADYAEVPDDGTGVQLERR